jgi:hypothetical protein
MQDSVLERWLAFLHTGLSPVEPSELILAHSRRSLQRLINENSEFLLHRHTRKHVQRLNLMEHEIALATEWEVVLINSFFKRGKVDHERSFDTIQIFTGSLETSRITISSPILLPYQTKAWIN